MNWYALSWTPGLAFYKINSNTGAVYQGDIARLLLFFVVTSTILDNFTGHMNGDLLDNEKWGLRGFSSKIPS